MMFLFRRSARGDAGFMLAPLLYMLVLAGIGAAVLFSGYSQILRSNAQMTAINAARSQLQAAGTTLAASSALDSATSTIVQPPAVYAFGSIAGGDTAKLPTNYTNASTTGSPHDVGVIDTSVGVRQLDPWGKFYIYCRWENAVSSPTLPSIMVITSGPDGNLDTKCGDTTAQGDDKITSSTVAETINRANVWQVSSSSQVKYGIAANPVAVNADGSITASMLTLGAAPAATTSGQISVVSANVSGALTAGSTTFSGANITGNATIGGTLGVSGATTLSSTLSAGASTLSSATISGNATVGGTLGVTGNTTLSGTLTAGASALSSLTLGTALAIAQGGTGATTASAALTNLGGLAIANNLSELTATAATARTNLGLGTMATQNANNVAITGGSISGVTFTGNITGNASGSAGSVAATGVTGCCVAISAGGTNAGDAATARSNLGTNNASNLTTGTVAVGLLPTSGVVAGTYTQVTVDVYGRVTVGANNSSSQWTNSGSNIYFNTGNVSIGTTVANTELNVYNASSATLTDFTQGLAKGAINVLTNYTANNYTPGVFWSATDDNATKPKAGIWLKEAAAGTTMYLGTSNAYATGITNQALSIDYNGVVTAAAGFVGNVTGNLIGNVTGNVSGQISLSDGTAASPGLYFTNDTNTGIYRPGADVLGIAAGGNDVARFTGNTSGVNYFNLSAATTGNAVTLAAAGTDTDIGIALTPKGTGNLNLTTGRILLAGNNGVAEQDSGNTTVVGATAAATNTTASAYTTAMGAQALNSLTNGANNSAFGYQALTTLSNGGGNSALGYQALKSVTSGGSNTGIGAQAGQGITSSSNNTAIGFQAMSNTSAGGNNTAVGWQALFWNTGAQNTGIGAGALFNNQGGNANTAVGWWSMITNQGGNNNTSMGYGSLYHSTASNNSAFGYSALGTQSSGANNTALGYQAGYDITTGGKNIFIGYYPTTAVGITTGSDNILIGDDLQELTVTGSNQLDIGNLIFATSLASGATLSTGKVGIGVVSPNHILDVNGNIGMAASSYLNWGSTDGATGYGIRDNGGTIEFKNSGGSWAAPLTASSTITANNFAAGSVGAPGLYVVGDSDTGFYSPAANTLSVTTGGVEVMRWNTMASGVNYFNVTPSATGNKITLGAAGSDTDIGIAITPKGAGNVVVSGSGLNQISSTTTSTTGGAAAFFGNASGASGATYGGLFQTASTTGIGVYGYASSGTGSNYGGYFQSASTGGTSLFSVAGNAATLGLVVRGAASQTGDLTEWQNSSGTVLAKVDASGNINAAGVSVSGTPVLTANQTITLTGDVTGSGATSIATTIAAGHVTNAMLAGSIDLTSKVTGTLPVGNGGTGTATAFTAGSVVYAGASGVYSQDNANFFWDATNHRLGIGTTSPAQALSVSGDALVNYNGTANDKILIGDIAGGQTYPGVWFGSNATSPSYSNYSFLWDSTRGTLFNAPSGVNGMAFRIANSAVMAINANGVAIGYGEASSSVPASGNSLIVSGNVGIGTTSPSAKLSIGNNIYTAPLGSSYGQYQIILYDTGTASSSYGVGIEGYNIGFNSNGGYKFYQNAGSTPLMVIGGQSSSNVGIGTASPGALLHVSGGSYNTSLKAEGSSTSGIGLDLKNTGTGGKEWTIISNGSANSGGAGPLQFYDVTDNITPMVILTSGNVGIGTTVPNQVLEVQSTTTNKGRIRLTGTGTTASNYDGLEIYGKGGVAGTFAGGLFREESTDRIAIWSSGGEMIDILANGNVGINQISPGSTLDVKGTLRLSGATSGYVGITPAAAAGSTTYTLPSADGSNGQALTTNGSGTLSWATPTASASGAAGYVQFSNGSALSSDSNFFWDNTNKRLGIGTTSPSYQLDVVNNQNAVTQARVRNSTDGTAGRAMFVAESSSSNGTYLESVSPSNTVIPAWQSSGVVSTDWNNLWISAYGASGVIKFQTGGAATANERMRIDSSGNVGIGTTTPGATSQTAASNFLDLESSAKSVVTIGSSSSAGYAFSEQVNDVGHSMLVGTYGSSFGSTFFGVSRSSNSFAMALSGQALAVGTIGSANLTLGTNNTAAITIDTSQRVGIGTTSPTNKLDIYSNATGKDILIGAWDANSSYNQINLNGLTGTGNYNFLSGNGDQNLYINRPSGGTMYFRENNSSQLTIASGGNVGIGTTSPGATLETYGTSGVTDICNVNTANNSGVCLEANNGGSAGIITGINPALNSVQPLSLQPFGGNVGIGTSSPVVRLDLGASAANVGQIFNIYSAGNIRSGIGMSASTAGIRIYSDSSDADMITFGSISASDGSTYSEKMRITNGGNVGIGQASPNAKLDISSNGGSDGIVLYQQLDNTETIQTYIDGHWSDRTTYAGGCCNVLALQPDVGTVGIGTTSPGATLDINSTASFPTPVLRIQGADANMNLALKNTGSGGRDYRLLSSNNSAYPAGALRFYDNTAGADRMVISSGGNVGIGTVGPDSPLEVYQGSNANAFHAVTVSNGAGYGYAVYAENGGINAGLARGDGYAFVGNGIVWATGAGQFNMSDARFKENIHDLDSGLDTLMKLRPVTYQWRPDSEAFKSAGSAIQFGLIAQEVNKVLPEIVILNKHPPTAVDKNGKQSLDAKIGESYGVEYTKIIPFLINAAQELKHMLDGVIADVKKLAARVDEAFAKLAAYDDELRNLEDENKQLRDAVCKLDASAKFCHPLKTGKTAPAMPPRADNDNLPHADNDNLPSRGCRRAVNA
jgi:fibronectin-binding autotransporter adhesin